MLPVTLLLSPLLHLGFVPGVYGFPAGTGCIDETQLTPEDIAAFDAVAFGDKSTAGAASQCKSFPGTPSWPTEEEWSQLNETLGGALLSPPPLASICYQTWPEFDPEACSNLLHVVADEMTFTQDPMATWMQWPQGQTCPLTQDPTGDCIRGGYPAYVVNATSVKHVQAAVNFARNRNIRLVIKNTGHDTIGRSLGAGSLSIWTHHLVGFDYLDDYVQPGGNYRGPAVCVGAGVQAFEALAYAQEHNITLLAPNSVAGCLTLGSYGGWFMGGGHSPLSSKFGLAADQVLSINLVTADGHYVTADPQTNPDLFFALRGGGGGTFGVVTSVIVKAHPPVNVTFTRFNFTLAATPSAGQTSGATVSDPETFWKGFREVLAFVIPTVEAQGFILTLTVPLGDNQFHMDVMIQMPDLTQETVAQFVQPLLDALNEAGIAVAIDTPITELYTNLTNKWGLHIGEWLFTTRMFPKNVLSNEVPLNDAVETLRAAVEAGHGFFTLSNAPTLEAAGYPAPAAVNPAWRETVMLGFLVSPVDLDKISPYEAAAIESRLMEHVDAVRNVTPGGGSYINEAHVLEADWQQSFFGDNYDVLLRIKREQDPWQLFWAPLTVGSEGWAVDDSGPLRTQNGPLCPV